jgi:hypothetical protein
MAVLLILMRDFHNANAEAVPLHHCDGAANRLPVAYSIYRRTEEQCEGSTQNRIHRPYMRPGDTADHKEHLGTL